METLTNIKLTVCTKLLLLVLLVLIINACNNMQTFDIGDGGLLSKGALCVAPCFMDITPGLTSRVDVIRILKANNYWSECVNDITIICYKNLGISFRKNTVDGVGFRPTTKITLEQVVEKYGEPDKFVVYNNENPEWIQLSLLFERIQTILDLRPQDGNIFVAEPSNKITNIAYSDIGSIEIFIVQGRARKWNGYRTYTDSNP